jgi:hypothetical protein
VFRVKWLMFKGEVFKTMKISSMINSAAALLILSVVAPSAFAGGQKEEVVVPSPAHHYAYVWVTGSRIPQRVIISPIGTTTFNSLSVWDRRQINQVGPGRFTTEGVLRNDPSVTIRMGHSGGVF